MDNLSALKRLCNAICNTFYPDAATAELMLFNEGINPTAEAQPKDQKILRVAIALVRGFIETSRSENGVSTANDIGRLDENIALWCREYGLDAEDYMLSVKVIEDGSNRW